MCSLRQELRKGPREQDAERLPPGQLRGTQDGKVLNPNGINLYKPPIWGLFLPPIKMLMTWGCCFFLHLPHYCQLMSVISVLLNAFNLKSTHQLG
jgi:hypothetical protein